MSDPRETRAAVLKAVSAYARPLRFAGSETTWRAPSTDVPAALTAHEHALVDPLVEALEYLIGVATDDNVSSALDALALSVEKADPALDAIRAYMGETEREGVGAAGERL